MESNKVKYFKGADIGNPEPDWYRKRHDYLLEWWDGKVWHQLQIYNHIKWLEESFDFVETAVEEEFLWNYIK